jgi:cytochrome c556
MAQEYTMTVGGLSPATSPEYRAAFLRANRLAALARKGTACTSGAAVILSEDIDPGDPKRPRPCIYPAKMSRPYGPETSFDFARDYENLGDIAWIPATRGTMVVRYRGADGGEGVVRMPMPRDDADDREKSEFQDRKADYLAKLTRGSGPVDTRSVVQALRDEAATAEDAPKPRKPRAKAIEAATPDTAAASALARVVEERDELRAEVTRLTREISEARTAADTDEADLARAAATIADLRAEVAGLRAFRSVPSFVPPPVVRA